MNTGVNFRTHSVPIIFHFQSRQQVHCPVCVETFSDISKVLEKSTQPKDCMFGQL